MEMRTDASVPSKATTSTATSHSHVMYKISQRWKFGAVNKSSGENEISAEAEVNVCPIIEWGQTEKPRG